ncbi:MAG: FG-GAP repeat protein, partial [Myxococcales bacterium]|nr:FG-GAP repeat protein [Myxococcales bacterium]
MGRLQALALLAVVGCQPGSDDAPFDGEADEGIEPGSPVEALADRSRADRQVPGFHLTIARDGSDVVVSFDPHLGSPTYTLWESDDPYFAPGDVGATAAASGASTSFTVIGGAALSTPRYWRVVADPGGGDLATSTTVGAWVQPLVAGYSLLSFPLLGTGVYDAESLVADEPLIDEVWVYDPVAGGFDGWFGTGEENLEWEPGQAIMVTYAGPAIEHRQLGHVSATSDVGRTLDVGLSLVTVPLALDATDAITLGASMPALAQLGDWNAAAQALDVFGPPAWGVNFDVEPGQGLWVWSNAAAPWPPAGTVPACGDGLVGVAEWCDDGNLVDGDGCEATCVPTPPTAGPNAYLAVQGTLLHVTADDGLLIDDQAYDGSPVTVLSAQATSDRGGTITVGATGSFDYAPPADAWGEDGFTYTVRDAQGATAQGRVTLVVRPVNIPLTAIAAGHGGFAIDGEAQFDSFGSAVAGAGDVNGDGWADVVIGAYGSTANGLGSGGRAYVVHGRPTTEPAAAADVAAGLGGFAIDARPLSGAMGRVVGGLGDVDGDGLDDVLATAPNAYLRGEAYVVHGRVATTPASATAVAAGVGGYLIEAEAPSSFMGYSADGVGDVNGDGVPDLVLSDFRSYLGQYESNRDRSYVVFGQAGTSPVSLADVAAGVGGFGVDNESTGNDHTVVSVAGAGDVNGDGLQDLVLGAAAADFGGADAGRSYVVFGKADGSPVSLAALGAGGFVIDGQLAGDASGYWVEGAGDVDGDGLDDVIVGAYAADPHGSSSGRAYVVLGKVDAQPVSLDDVAAGIGGFVMNG